MRRFALLALILSLFAVGAPVAVSTPAEARCVKVWIPEHRTTRCVLESRIGRSRSDYGYRGDYYQGGYAPQGYYAPPAYYPPAYGPVVVAPYHHHHDVGGAIALGIIGGVAAGILSEAARR